MLSVYRHALNRFYPVIFSVRPDGLFLSETIYRTLLDSRMLLCRSRGARGVGWLQIRTPEHRGASAALIFLYKTAAGSEIHYGHRVFLSSGDMDFPFCLFEGDYIGVRGDEGGGGM